MHLDFIALFAAGLSLTSISSLVLSRSLETLGGRLKLSEGLLGVLVAFGANAPELSTAAVALIKGQRDLGLGVILGSNIFNLAALLGLSAVISGKLFVKRAAAISSGGASLLVAVLISPLLEGLLGARWALLCVLFVLVPHVVLLSRRAETGSGVPDKARPALKGTAGSTSQGGTLAAVPALAAVVLGSTWMVHSAEALGSFWHVSHAILGALILATVTGIPNVVAAVRLAQRKRGTAVLTEAFSSNNLNILFGVCLPAVFLVLARASSVQRFETWYLVGMTSLATILLATGKGLGRLGGGVLISAYGVFVLMTVCGI